MEGWNVEPGEGTRKSTTEIGAPDQTEYLARDQDRDRESVGRSAGIGQQQAVRGNYKGRPLERSRRTA